MQLAGKGVKLKKSKVFPVEAMKPYNENRGIVPPVLNLCTRCRLVIKFRLRPLYCRYSMIEGWLGPRGGLDDLEDRKICDVAL